MIRVHHQRERLMTWRRLLVAAAVAAAADVVFRYGWRKGFLDGAQEAEDWWREEVIRLLEVRDLEWQGLVSDESPEDRRDVRPRGQMQDWSN
jgi:hypothetical protein